MSNIITRGLGYLQRLITQGFGAQEDPPTPTDTPGGSTRVQPSNIILEYVSLKFVVSKICKDYKRAYDVNGLVSRHYISTVDMLSSIKRTVSKTFNVCSLISLRYVNVYNTRSKTPREVISLLEGFDNI